MPDSRPPIPNRVRKAADLRPISRPNVNFDHDAIPLPTHAIRDDYVGTNHLRDRLRRRPTRVLASASGSEERLDAPLPVSTSSINWWPYPPWGQSTVSPTPSETATSSSLPSLVAAVSLDTPSSTTSSLSATPTPNPSAVLGVTIISVSVSPPATSIPSRSNVHATAHSSFNPLYLIPVFVALGLAIGALSGLLGYRWYLRRQARKGGGSSGSWKATLIPGPPYVPTNDTNHDARGIQEAALTPVGSPSKYTRHGAPATGSHRASTHNTTPPSRETIAAAAAAASSHSRPLSANPTRARSRGSAISPISLSDEESSRHHSSRIRRSILKRLKRGPDRNTRGVSRDLSRRTAQTYVSTASAYSGTHSGDSRPPSAVPSATPLSCDANTEWVPRSGFRIVEETISSPSTARQSSPSGLPGRTSAWDNGEALRQAVDTHPGERWLAWTRSWASSPPHPSQDRFTAVPSRRVGHEKDIEVLLRSPPQVTSSPLESTLTFTPQLGLPARPGTSAKRHLRGTTRTRTARGISNASSVAQGDGHGTPAMRFAARHTALSRVEEILAHSYSSRDLSHDSPNAFGATPGSLDDIAWAAGIEQRLAVADYTDRGGV